MHWKIWTKLSAIRIFLLLFSEHGKSFTEMRPFFSKNGFSKIGMLNIDRTVIFDRESYDWWLKVRRWRQQQRRRRWLIINWVVSPFVDRIDVSMWAWCALNGFQLKWKMQFIRGQVAFENLYDLQSTNSIHFILTRSKL